MDGSAPAQRRHPSEVHELIAVLLLALVAVLTAWCGFQASQWGGDSTVLLNQSSDSRIDAAGLESQGRDARALDLAVYAQWVIAEAHGDQDLADYIAARFSPEFATAFAAWEADGRVEKAPFARKEYVPPGTEAAEAALAKADSEFQRGLDFNDKSDSYSLMTVLFALVLFLSAIAQRGISILASRIVLGLAGVLALIGVITLLTFPIRF